MPVDCRGTSVHPISFIALDHDVLLSILFLLSVKDVSSLRQTCSTMHSVTKTNALWVRKVLQIKPLLPSLQKRVELSAAEDLEILCRHSLRLQANWQLDSPVPAAVMSFAVPPMVTCVKIFGPWLLVASIGGHRSSIAVYDINLDSNVRQWSPSCLSGQDPLTSFPLRGPVYDVAFDISPTANLITFSCQSR
ncbi:hypothetical protein JAAARDRAFT_592527 [Jaapia argillacea MUCL 33604]|uniref:F-box domain-containing protein n=1 Tax=Jaapia argillacea MUCL 33604 TaxID=933084 RepID=A0A067Q917_9AGAM|nr:hypothetical protein JAAARDRAFT_592527 [Jaapia argillacea MUCL 33604]